MLYLLTLGQAGILGLWHRNKQKTFPSNSKQLFLETLTIPIRTGIPEITDTSVNKTISWNLHAENQYLKIQLLKIQELSK